VFITIEGIEGSGKTTQVALLATALERARYRVLVTREPGGTELGSEIRSLLLHSGKGFGRFAELFLILADRAEHVETVLRPALGAGNVVLCDRFSDSTIAYQAYGRELPVDAVRAVDTVARQGLLPDLTFVLDCPVETGLARTHRRRGDAAADRFENEHTNFHERVRRGFLALACEDARRVRVVEGTRSVDLIHEEILTTAIRQLQTAHA
jgi:dTMP kinase